MMMHDDDARPLPPSTPMDSPSLPHQASMFARDILQNTQHPLFCISLLVIMDDFDDDDILASVIGVDGVNGVNGLRFDPEAKRKREEDHERVKESFHKNLSSPRRKKKGKKKRRKKDHELAKAKNISPSRKKKRRKYQGDVDWEKVEKQEYESALFPGSVIMVRGPWQQKGWATRKIWFPCVIVPRIAWGMEKFDLDRAFDSSDVAVWVLGIRLGENGVFWTNRDNIKPFPLSVDDDEQQQRIIEKWPKKLRDEFATAYRDAVRLVSVVKVNEEIRGARWDRQRQEEEAAEEAKKARLQKAEASLTDEDRRKIREAGERFMARVISGMSRNTQANE
jgi:hypothetical protein